MLSMFCPSCRNSFPDTQLLVINLNLAGRNVEHHLHIGDRIEVDYVYSGNLRNLLAIEEYAIVVNGNFHVVHLLYALLDRSGARM